MFPEIGGPARARRPVGLVGRILAAIVAIATLVVGILFSVFLFAAALVAGLALFGWIWWKMRRALQQARQDPRFQAFQERARQSAPGQSPPGGNGDVIEGEVLREEWKDRRDQR
jgi:hypothetical protein